MDKISMRLDEVINERLDHMSAQGGALDEKSVDQLVILYKLRFEELKIQQAADQASDEALLRQQEAEEERKANWLKTKVDAIESAGKLVLGAGLFLIGLKFEETGVISSFSVRNIAQKVFPNFK